MKINFKFLYNWRALGIGLHLAKKFYGIEIMLFLAWFAIGIKIKFRCLY